MIYPNLPCNLIKSTCIYSVFLYVHVIMSPASSIIVCLHVQVFDGLQHVLIGSTSHATYL
ncbi:hypothetical protein V8C42DRAFT_330867 [Trichoderma barbatum]